MGETKLNQLKVDAQEQHKITEALRTLKLATEELKSGYRFDDQWASEKIQLIEQAYKTLQTKLGKDI